MPIQGADLAQLRELAAKFDGQAGQLEGIIADLQNATRTSGEFWKGGKADTFRTEWDGVKPLFDRFVQTLRDAGQAARTNADNIERATN
ncbi:WXG100 family type VII secretion target [Streptomycetaceae bacterium NBC_01309]